MATTSGREARHRRAWSGESTAGRIAIASHELRRPLTVVIGYLETLARLGGDVTEAARAEMLARALGAAWREVRLIEQLLDHAHSENGDLDVSPAPISLREHLDRIVHEYLRPEERARVEIDLPDHLVVSADPSMFERVVSNLLVNALEVSGGVVRLEAHDRTEEVVVSVVDEGPGVAPESRDRIFDPFETIDGRGPGLGLAIARKASEHLGGRLWVEDGTPFGARFSFTLPRTR